MIHPQVATLLNACPFIVEYLDADDWDLPTIIFGDAARLLKSRTMRPADEDALFDYFNRLAEEGDAGDLETLGTGAIELFNDDKESQSFARAKLKGRALVMLEEFRGSWGQPDYGKPE